MSKQRRNDAAKIKKQKLKREKIRKEQRQRRQAAITRDRQAERAEYLENKRIKKELREKWRKETKSNEEVKAKRLPTPVHSVSKTNSSQRNSFDLDRFSGDPKGSPPIQEMVDSEPPSAEFNKAAWGIK